VHALQALSRRDNSLGTITFDFKGRTTAVVLMKKPLSFLLQMSPLQRCLMISKPLGLIRTGIYAQHNGTTVDPTDLATDPIVKFLDTKVSICLTSLTNCNCKHIVKALELFLATVLLLVKLQ